MKRCPKCGEVKKLSQFYKNKNNKDGVFSYCKECKSKIQHEDYEYYKELGLCVQCKKDNAMVGSTVCPECADKKAEYDRLRWEKLKKSSGFPEYQRKHLIYENNLRQKRRDAGICHICGKRPVEKGYARCYECLIERRKNRAKLDIPRSARPSYGLCYFCGEPVLADKKVCQKHYEINILNIKPGMQNPYHPWQQMNNLLFTGGKNEQKGN